MVRSLIILQLCLFEAVSARGAILLAHNFHNNQYQPYPYGTYQSNPYGGYQSSPYKAPQYQTQQPVTVNQTFNVPSNVQYGNQFYGSSLDGLRDLIDENHRTAHPEEYKKLNSHLSSLERQHSKANWIHGLSLAFALGYIIWGPVPKERTWCGSYYNGTCSYNVDNHAEISDARSKNTYIGLGVWLIGLSVSVGIEPGRREIMKFINEHNRLLPNEPIKMNLGFWMPSNKDVGLGLALTF
jgi:hypothetical protein